MSKLANALKMKLTMGDIVLTKATRSGFGSLYYQKRILKTEKFIPKAQLLPLIQKNIKHPDLARLRCRLDVNKDDFDPIVLCEDPESTEGVDLHISEHVGSFNIDEKINELGKFGGPFLTEQNGLYGPGWDIQTCSNGSEHFVMIRLDHWVGDGIATMDMTSKLLGFDYPMPDMIKKRIVPDKISLRDLPGLWYILKDLFFPKLVYSPLSGKAKDHVEAIEAHAIVCFPALDINKLKQAAKKKGTTLTIMLLVIIKQFQINYYKFVGEPLPKQYTFGTTIAANREVNCNMSYASIFNVDYDASFEADAKKIKAEIEYVNQCYLNLMVVQRKLFKMMSPAKVSKQLYDMTFSTKDGKPVAILSNTATSFPGPKKKIEVCGVRVHSWYNSVTSGQIPVYNLTGYGDAMNIALTGPKHLCEERELLRLWRESFEEICGEPFEELLEPKEKTESMDFKSL